MVLVAVAALALGAELARRRGEDFAEKAARHDMQAGEFRILADHRSRFAATCREEAGRPEGAIFKSYVNDQRNPQQTAEWLMKSAAEYMGEAKYELEHASYHEELKTKYQHAARYPWLPVAPDPPKPRRKR
jgi:hypothetical protein